MSKFAVVFFTGPSLCQTAQQPSIKCLLQVRL